MGVTEDNLKDFPGEVYNDDTGKTNFMVTSIDKLANWARSNSLWPLTFGTSCCGWFPQCMTGAVLVLKWLVLLHARPT